MVRACACVYVRDRASAWTRRCGVCIQCCVFAVLTRGVVVGDGGEGGSDARVGATVRLLSARTPPPVSLAVAVSGTLAPLRRPHTL